LYDVAMQPRRNVACQTVVVLGQLPHGRCKDRFAAVEIERRSKTKRVSQSLACLEKRNCSQGRCDGEAHSVDLAGGQHDKVSRSFVGYGLFPVVWGRVRRLAREDAA